MQSIIRIDRQRFNFYPLCRGDGLQPIEVTILIILRHKGIRHIFRRRSCLHAFTIVDCVARFASQPAARTATVSTSSRTTCAIGYQITIVVIQIIMQTIRTRDIDAIGTINSHIIESIIMRMCWTCMLLLLLRTQESYPHHITITT